MLGSDLRPGVLKGFAGGGNGKVDIFLRGFVDGDDGFLGGGVDGLECFAILTFDEFVVDEAVKIQLLLFVYDGVCMTEIWCGVEPQRCKNRRQR